MPANTIPISFSEEHYSFIKKAAEKTQLSASDFVRKAACSAASELLAVPSPFLPAQRGRPVGFRRYLDEGFQRLLITELKANGGSVKKACDTLYTSKQTVHLTLQHLYPCVDWLELGSNPQKLRDALKNEEPTDAPTTL